MAKKRMTPLFALTKTPNLKIDGNTDLEAHLIEVLAIEALSDASADKADLKSSSWTTSIDKRFEVAGTSGLKGALSFAAFRGKIAPNPTTGDPEAELTAERKLSLDDYRAHGLFDDLGHAEDEWEGDDIALGINFSRLHRIARLIENRAPDFLAGLMARISEDMLAHNIYSELKTAADRRRQIAEEEHARQQEQWKAEQAERERLAQERREKERLALLELKRTAAEIVGRTFEDDLQLDHYVETSVNTTGKGYENAFHKSMPEEYLKCGPFTWARVLGSDHPRIFFDVNGRRIPEPS